MFRREAPDDNRPRFTERGSKGHVESWFWRANHPTERRAVWLKATVYAPIEGPAVAETWCAVFGPGTAKAAKRTVPLGEARFGSRIAIDACTFDVLEHLQGTVDDMSWDLRITPEPGPLGERVRLYPLERMMEGGFPKKKLVTPMPVGRFSGTVTVGDETIAVDDWVGMQGHNWGPHGREYAWGQAVFRDADGTPFAMVEAAAGKVDLGPVTTPTLGTMLVRHGGREWRFDRVVDRWRTQFRRDDLAFSAKFRSSKGEAMLELRARPEEMACLGYLEADGGLRYCLNSKLASARLRVNPVNEDGFECFSEHGGALEFLQMEADPRVGDPV